MDFFIYIYIYIFYLLASAAVGRHFVAERRCRNDFLRSIFLNFFFNLKERRVKNKTLLGFYRVFYCFGGGGHFYWTLLRRLLPLAAILFSKNDVNEKSFLKKKNVIDWFVAIREWSSKKNTLLGFYRVSLQKCSWGTSIGRHFVKQNKNRCDLVNWFLK